MAEESIEVSRNGLQGLEKALGELQAANGQPQPWVIQNPVKTLMAMLGILSVVWGGVQWYAGGVAARAVTEEQTEQYRDATNGKVKAVKDDVETFKAEAKTAHGELSEGINEVGRLQLEQGRDQRELLKDLAKKARIEVADPGPQLKAARADVEARTNR